MSVLCFIFADFFFAFFFFPDKASAPPLPQYAPPPAIYPSSASVDVPTPAPCVTPPPIPIAFGEGSHTTPNQLSQHLTRHLHEGTSNSSARTPVTLQRSITKAELERTYLQVAIYQEQVCVCVCVRVLDPRELR